jgi:hypothetical protein
MENAKNNFLLEIGAENSKRTVCPIAVFDVFENPV